MRRLLAPLLLIALAAPSLADVRPMPRPERILAFAGATELALRHSPRPLRSPDIVPEPAALRITMVPDRVSRLLALEPAAALPLPVDPGLRAAVAAQGMVVTTSASNAPRMPDAAAAVRAAFVAVPGPALQPRARPDLAQVVPAALVFAPRLRPAARPPLAKPEVALSVPAIKAAPDHRLALTSPRPVKRPSGLFRRAETAAAPEAEIIKTAAVRVNPGEQLVKPKRGSVCGDRRIRGETIPPVPARVKGCGLADPVRVTEVDGVRLSPAATIDCTTALALKSWIANGLKPAAGQRGVTELKVAASYACRPRNNVTGNKISEHGKGRAIDISAVVLGNGQVLDVLRDYRRGEGKLLRAAHKAACGPFGTTLGPGSDGYHENHLHFDTARYRSGAYCR